MDMHVLWLHDINDVFELDKCSSFLNTFPGSLASCEFSQMLHLYHLLSNKVYKKITNIDQSPLALPLYMNINYCSLWWQARNSFCYVGPTYTVIDPCFDNIGV